MIITFNSNIVNNRTMRNGFVIMKGGEQWRDISRLLTPSLVGACFLYSPKARAIILHSDLLPNDTCYVTGRCTTYWENIRKRSDIVFNGTGSAA